MTDILLIRELSKSVILSMRQGGHEAKEKFLLQGCKLLSWLGLLPAIWKSKLAAEPGQSNISSVIKMPLGL